MQAIQLAGYFAISEITVGAPERGSDWHRPANAATIDFTLRGVDGQEILEDVYGTAWSIDVSAN